MAEFTIHLDNTYSVISFLSISTRTNAEVTMIELEQKYNVFIKSVKEEGVALSSSPCHFVSRRIIIGTL